MNDDILEKKNEPDLEDLVEQVFRSKRAVAKWQQYCDTACAEIMAKIKSLNLTSPYYVTSGATLYSFTWTNDTTLSIKKVEQKEI
jgi:hypothetical protein